MSEDSTDGFSLAPFTSQEGPRSGTHAKNDQPTFFYEQKDTGHKSISSVLVSPRLSDLLFHKLRIDPDVPPATGEQESTFSDAETESSTCHRYRIEKELGRGGMGTVYAGWDVQLQRRVAIKLLSAEESGKSNSLLRFFREARIASRLQHPAIISVYDFDLAANGQAFIVMERLAGQTLRSVLDGVKDRSSEMPSLLRTFLQACQGVAYAHDQGVIHRDLKPANIMVGNYGVVTVLDWGLAKVIGVPDLLSDSKQEDVETAAGKGPKQNVDMSINPEKFETRFGTVFGTPGYLAPEQARGEIDRIDKRTDVFALGCILCEILTGSPPFAGKDLLETCAKAAAGRVSGAIASLDECKGPRSIVNLAKRCLSPSLTDRPQDVLSVVNTLVEFLESGQRRAEQDLVRFFDLSLDLFCIANLSGYFCRVNDNFSRLLGYSSQELTACKFFDFVHPEDQGSTLAAVEKLSRGEPAIQFMNRYRHIDGHYLWLEWNARSVPEEASIYAVARDVTERVATIETGQRFEEERFRLSQIVDSADDAIISNDLLGVIQSWNSGAENLFGYAASEMIGQPITHLLPAEQICEEERILSRISQGLRVEPFETVWTHKNGWPVEVSLTISPVHDAEGNVVGAFKMARDIGEQKKLGKCSTSIVTH